MKRTLLQLVSVYLCLLAAFSCGLGELLLCDREARPSYTENRMLQAFPAFSLRTLRSGSFMEDFEAWLSDAFFFREQAAGFTEQLKKPFSVASEDGGPDELASDRLWEMNEEEQQQLDRFLAEVDAEAAREDEASAAEPGDPAAPEASLSSDPTEAAALSDCRRPTPEVSESASFWISAADGTRTVIDLFPAANIAVLARVLNEYVAALPPDGTVSMLAPMMSKLANSVLLYGSAADWDCDLEEVLQPYLDDGAHFFDLPDILRPYIGQYTLYPTIDHHWHPISCKLAVNAMLRSQGVVPNQYEEYLYGLSRLRHSGFFTAEELPDVTENIEQVPALVLNAPAESYLITSLNHREPSVLIARNNDEYLQYLGGSKMPWREFVTGFHTGRNALVIGDSFTLVLIPYLFPYYDTVMATDFRDGYSNYFVGANAKEYMDYYQISDVYIVYCNENSPNSVVVQDRLERFLFKDYSN